MELRSTNRALKAAAYAALAALASAALALTVLAQPALAADGSFIDSLNTAFDSGKSIIWVIYYGLLGLAFGLFLVKVGKELIPAMLNNQSDEKSRFKEHLGAAGFAAAVFVLLFLAPIWAPSLVQLFAGNEFDSYITRQ